MVDGCRRESVGNLRSGRSLHSLRTRDRETRRTQFGAEAVFQIGFFPKRRAVTLHLRATELDSHGFRKTSPDWIKATFARTKPVICQVALHPSAGADV